jgi:type II secretory pathway pseudopilin PulG
MGILPMRNIQNTGRMPVPRFPAHATGFGTQPASSRSAFSLVEIVLAIGLVSFSMLAIFALVAQGHKTSREARLESTAALLAGKINSQLRASSVWTTTAGSDATNFIGNTTLAAIAAGSPVTRTNHYDLNLSNVTTTKPDDRQFEVVTTVALLAPTNTSSPNSDVTAALSRLTNAQNTVLLSIEVSAPALAPHATRSKRHFASIITRTSPN